MGEWVIEGTEEVYIAFEHPDELLTEHNIKGIQLILHHSIDSEQRSGDNGSTR